VSELGVGVTLQRRRGKTHHQAVRSVKIRQNEFSHFAKKKEKRDERTLVLTVLCKSVRVYVHVLCCRCSCSHSMRIRCTIMHYKSRFVILYFFSSNYAAELSINCSLKIFLYSLFILTPLMTATLALSLNTCTHGVPIIPADSAISGSSAMSIST
jgi:hypothetical protein